MEDGVELPWSDTPEPGQPWVGQLKKKRCSLPSLTSKGLSNPEASSQERRDAVSPVQHIRE